MIARNQGYYVDVRRVAHPNKISLDLTRHLPSRAAIGPVAIVTERPLVLLSVIKKRWGRIIYTAERQYASTLDQEKRKSLQNELTRLHSYSFGANSLKAVDILFLASGRLLPDTTYHTIYLHTLEESHLPYVIAHLKPDGLLVMYTDIANKGVFGKAVPPV